MFGVKIVEKVKYEDYDLAPDCYNEYNVEAKILKNIPDKYLGLNKEEIKGLVIHPTINNVKFLASPNLSLNISCKMFLVTKKLFPALSSLFTIAPNPPTGFSGLLI